MSAVLAHFARDEGIEIKLQLMVVPATDMRYCSPNITVLDAQNCPYESARMFQNLPWSPVGREQWFLKYWLGEDAGKFIRTTMSAVYFGRMLTGSDHR